MSYRATFYRSRLRKLLTINYVRAPLIKEGSFSTSHLLVPKRGILGVELLHELGEGAFGKHLLIIGAVFEHFGADVMAQ